MAADISYWYRNYTDSDTTYEAQYIYNFPEPYWNAPEGKQFKEWNTERDGSGHANYPGDLILIGGMWYAIWENIPHEAKLLDVTQFETALTATAEAIRAKTGSSEDINFSMEDGFASTITTIPTDLNDATGESFGSGVIAFTTAATGYPTYVIPVQMTWTEFVNSTYNPSSGNNKIFSISNGYVGCRDGSIMYLKIGDTYVLSEDQIISGTVYSCGSIGGGDVVIK